MAKAKAAQSKKFPTTLYVPSAEVSAGQNAVFACLDLDVAASNIEGTDDIAVYTLTTVRKFKRTIEEVS